MLLRNSNKKMLKLLSMLLNRWISKVIFTIYILKDKRAADSSKWGLKLLLDLQHNLISHKKKKLIVKNIMVCLHRIIRLKIKVRKLLLKLFKQIKRQTKMLHSISNIIIWISCKSAFLLPLKIDKLSSKKSFHNKVMKYKLSTLSNLSLKTL